MESEMCIKSPVITRFPKHEYERPRHHFFHPQRMNVVIYVPHNLIHQPMSSSSPDPTFTSLPSQDYHHQREICYLADFLHHNHLQPESFYASLEKFHEDSRPHSKKQSQHKSLNQITDDMDRRMKTWGQLDAMSKITKKNATSKGQNDNYYDQGDSFIDDGEDDCTKKNKDLMVIVYAAYGDFQFFEGSPAEFVKSQLYKERMGVVANTIKEVAEESKKKVLENVSPVRRSAVESRQLATENQKNLVEGEPVPISKHIPDSHMVEESRIKKKLKKESTSASKPERTKDKVFATCDKKPQPATTANIDQGQPLLMTQLQHPPYMNTQMPFYLSQGFPMDSQNMFMMMNQRMRQFNPQTNFIPVNFNSLQSPSTSVHPPLPPPPESPFKSSTNPPTKSSFTHSKTKALNKPSAPNPTKFLPQPKQLPQPPTMCFPPLILKPPPPPHTQIIHIDEQP